MQKRQDYPQAMKNKVLDYALESYDELPTEFDKIYSVENTKDSFKEYTSLLGPSSLTETEEGEEITSDTNTEGFTSYCAVKKWATDLPVTSECIDDNRQIADFLKTWAQGLGEATRSDKEQRHFDLFNYGGYTAGHKVFNNAVTNTITPTYGDYAYDAKPFLNLSDNRRTAKNNSTFYNAISSLSLDESGIQTLWQLMCVDNAFNEAGRKVVIIPTYLICKAGSNNWFAARKILESLGSVTAAHEGVTNLWRDKLTVLGSRFITSNDFWALVWPKKGLKSLLRKPLSVDYWEDKKKDTEYVRGITRWGCAVSNFRCVVAAGVSTS